MYRSIFFPSKHRSIAIPITPTCLTRIPGARSKKDIDCSALAKQAFGVNMKAAHTQGEKFESYNEYIRYCVKLHEEAAKAKFPEWFETHNGHNGGYR